MILLDDTVRYFISFSRSTEYQVYDSKINLTEAKPLNITRKPTFILAMGVSGSEARQGQKCRPTTYIDHTQQTQTTLALRQYSADTASLVSYLGENPEPGDSNRTFLYNVHGH